jgi:putative hydrolase of the HAD superfamily
MSRAQLNKPISGIFFDIGWTLNYPPSGNWMLGQKVFDCMDPVLFKSLPQNAIDMALSKAMRYLDEHHLLFSEEEEYTQFQTFYHIFVDSLPEIHLSREAIDQLAYDHVHNFANYAFYPDVKETLSYLSKKFKLGIISDTWPSVERLLREEGIYEFFSSVTLSCHLGVFKPHPKMYKHALQVMGLPPSQTIFVDDSPVNLDGARLFGIQPILISRNDKNIGDDHYLMINQISDLKALLD